MSEEVMTNTEQAVDNTQPAGNGKAAEKTFTQEEVNRIVSDRLARERTKAQQPTPVDEREQALALRENALNCREFIEKNKNYPPELLDLLDTSDFEGFKSMAEKLLKVFPNISPGNPVVGVPLRSGLTHGTPSSMDRFAKVFQPKQ